MNTDRLMALMCQDPAVRQALTAAFGKSDTHTLRAVLSGTTSEVVAKSAAAMVAQPKNAKMLIAKPKPPPTPKVASAAAAPSAPPSTGAVQPPAPKIAKAEEDFDFVAEAEFAKFDDAEMTVFGWASITEVDGVPVVDRQGDMIDATEMAKAAYDYVISSRTGGHQHQQSRPGIPLKVSDMIESVVFTPEKIAKMGLPADTPVGWWVGYKVHDDTVWKGVLDGDITGFSIHGKGKRIPVGG